MNREVHVRFWEGVGVKSSRATQLSGLNSLSLPIYILSEHWPAAALASPRGPRSFGKVARQQASS